MIQRRKKEQKEWKKAPYRPPEPIELPARNVEQISGRLDDLRSMIRQFICLFPYPVHLDIKVNNWSAALKDYPVASIQRVLKFYLNQPGTECPTLSDILGDIRELKTTNNNEVKTFPLPGHECRQVEKPESFVLSMLAAVSPYAAAHVACDCPGTPVCPDCGVVVEASMDPVVLHIMERHPQDTVDWKPERKGYALCPKCRTSKN